MESNSLCNHMSEQRPYATGGLEDSGRRNDEKMSRETLHSQSYATFFHRSAVLSLPAVLFVRSQTTKSDDRVAENCNGSN